MSRWVQGYACAVAVILRGHGSSTETDDALKAGCLATVADLMKARVDPADLDVLEPVVRRLEGHGMDYNDLPDVPARLLGPLRDLHAATDQGQSLRLPPAVARELLAAGLVWHDWQAGDYRDLRYKPSPLGLRALKQEGA